MLASNRLARPSLHSAQRSVKRTLLSLDFLEERAVMSHSPVVPVTVAFSGTTGTSLDSLVQTIVNDPGLRRSVTAADLLGGAQAANGMNTLIVDAIRATGVANDHTLNIADVRTLSEYLRAHNADQWRTLFGTEKGKVETGFHLVQNDGANAKLFGKNAVNTVADGIYHLGFQVVGSRFLDEKGHADASIETVTSWLSKLLKNDFASGKLDNPDVNPYAVGSTGTGLDKLITIVAGDVGLNRHISTTQITAGANAADGMNQLVVAAIKATGIADDKSISTDDVRVLNAYIQAHDATAWASLHGKDTRKTETGFHLVEGDGATSCLYGHNAVDTVADGIFHLGFNIVGGRFLNELGKADVAVKQVASWLSDLLKADLAAGTLHSVVVTPTPPAVAGTTYTGLDQLVSIIANDSGLLSRLPTDQIVAGAQAADGLNQVIVSSIRFTGVAADGSLSVDDVMTLNAYIKQNYGSLWTTLHGSGQGTPTGFHVVEAVGAVTQLFATNAVEGVAEGIYCLGFDTAGDQFVNELGTPTVQVAAVASWLNQLLAVDLANGNLFPSPNS